MNGPTLTASFPTDALPFDGSNGNWLHSALGEVAWETRIEPGLFSGNSWLSLDFYNAESELIQLRLEFVVEAGTAPRVFELLFAIYPQVRARLRMPASAMSLNSWLLPREGALLKPMCGGDRVLPEELTLLRLRPLAAPGGKTAKWWQSPLNITSKTPELLEKAEAAGMPILDLLGQSANRNWVGKTRDESALLKNIQKSAGSGENAGFPAGWSRWGGSTKNRIGEGTGYFCVHHDGRRWWLVDPEGYAFWSTGLCCVSPLVEAAIGGLEHLLAWQPDDSPQWRDAVIQRTGIFGGRAINFLAANFIRVFGADQWRAKWELSTSGFMRRRGFNTVGNWSDWKFASRAGLPYTRPLRDIDTIPVQKIFRDFPDVFAPEFQAGALEWAEQLRETRNDPAFIGYFICNEPNWALTIQKPAEGMLINTETAASRVEFGKWLRGRYADDEALSQAWGLPTSFGSVERGRWALLPESEAFVQDTETFSGLMAGRLFDMLGAACRAVDPNHLNLGARFHALPPEWMMGAFDSFDVFSFNSYSKLPRPVAGEISSRLRRPVLVGEWHFGAADVGLPAAGLETVETQRDRALAYRRYVEAHAAEPWCVGTHWFTLYDQSAIGRYDGEPYNCGFLDVCQRQYEELADAAQLTHERVYAIAAGVSRPEVFPAIGYTKRLSI